MMERNTKTPPVRVTWLVESLIDGVVFHQFCVSWSCDVTSLYLVPSLSSSNDHA